MENQTLGMAANSQMDNSYLQEKKFEFMIESSNKRIANELAILKSAISKLDGEIVDLKRQLNSAQRADTTDSENTNNNTAASRADAQTKAKDNRAPKPRYGEYEPDDVPIEKFFYFGNKK